MVVIVLGILQEFKLVQLENKDLLKVSIPLSSVALVRDVH